ncbi:ankyrin repeat domain-containing protein [Flavobacterium sp. GT3R68]|uniref:ankyrin repeat domain-containing protein n=1 Tax=Flavobacterium sp. GT3R68 TaxID=2594437 RepID=UPI000F860658|nr:ankyrin repeat domain-containing protein [Flavobacterium sp. GT3R68]RTY90580.1 ankyrin repeat domain-containing protein [Flavobacterium sp. GSN2]TRW89894.1 ankyrin repeat domain-containing protein [Flavobacterium sp. GT3R68]
MKKSIVYLGIALVAFANVSMAAGDHAPIQKVITFDKATPLAVAISKGEVELVKKFIEYGADVNETSNGMTPLMIAARYNNVEIIKILLASGAKAGATNERGYTALKYAELSQAKEAIALLKKG